MEIKDVIGIEKPLTKLIEVCADGIKGVCAPWQMRRLARAEADKSLILQDADIQKMITRAETEEFLQTRREKRQADNLSKIVDVAYTETRRKKEVSRQAVDADWSARFFDYAQDVSDEAIQVIWGKILAGEVERPGRFSKRTLALLRNLSKSEGEYFVELSRYVILYAVVAENDILFSSYPSSKVRSLSDAGLLNLSPVDATFEIIDRKFMIGDLCVFVEPDSIKKMRNVIFKSFLLTRSALELYDLMETQTPDPEYVIYFLSRLKKAGVKLRTSNEVLNRML